MAFTKIVGAGIQTTTDVTVGNVQAGIITATTFSGSFTGAVTGTATSTTNIPNLTGAITSSNTTTSLGSFSSSNLATALTDETGSGAAVFATSPTLSTVTVSSGGINVTGVSTFSGGIQGNVTGNVNSSGVSTFSSVNVTGNVSIGGTLTYDDVTNVDSIGLVTARSGVRIDAGGLVVTAGVSTFTTGPVIIGAATSTGTASQPLQVTGGAYVSGNIGVGTTNPQAPLHVVGSGTTALLVSGNARITGILTVGTSSLTFDGNANTITGLSTITGSSNFSKPNLSGISSSISSTATDVFVYDTSKDSDGGAWRKRTQNTSWYNETLNTATRGSRKDFPAVAVIVAETSKVTIYDGDDPDLPMWMVFNVSNTTWFKLHYSGSQCSCITALNATLFAGGNGSGIRLAVVDFIKDNQYLTEAGYTYYQTNGIVTRNDTTTHTNDGGSKSIVNNVVNDVAMTVLPNAPIDPATGLPIPTIAVATAGGASVIKDDGTVVDIIAQVGAGYNPVSGIDITEDYHLIFEQDTEGRAFFCIPIPSADRITATNDGSITDKVVMKYYSAGNHIPYPCFLGSGIEYGISLGEGDNQALVSTTGDLTILHPDFNAPANGMVAYAATSYNTGWMHGDIKGAFLSDTDDTNVTGSELVTNGTFDSDVSGWSFDRNDGTTTASVSSGRLTLTRGTDSGVDEFRQDITFETGKRYVLTIKKVSGSGIVVRLNESTLSQQILSANTTYSYTVTAGGTSSAIRIWALSNNTFITIDDISVRLAEPDRSVNNKGLQVFGTITKTPVATGADLVGYGFNGSNSNYLLQPYNSDLDFGTGDFSVMYWYYQNTSPTTYQDVVSRTTSPLSDGNWTIQHFPNDSVYMYHRVSGNWNTLGISGSNITHNGWNFIVITRSGSTCRMYFDGVQVDSRINAYTMTNTSAQLKISTRVDNTSYPLESGNSVALVRISASAPSPEQIKKIYEDEKVLFQENSKAVLYGASDAVTALAYDEVNDLLHVGTSSGRSDFQGLRRINNTTTAVTTAISAYDSFVVEQ